MRPGRCRVDTLRDFINNVERISINKCREILGKEVELMSDVQIEAFRDAVYALVESSLDNLDQLSNVCNKQNK